MDIIRFAYPNLPEKKDKLTMVLGFFDGMHRGHQSLFQEARYVTKNLSSVLLFTSMPFKGKDSTCLMNLEDKIRFLQGTGIDIAYVVETTDEFFALSPESFIKDFLLPLGVTQVVVGEDYTFGAKGKGKPEDLSKYLDVVTLPLLLEDGNKISSSRLKEAIKMGNVEEASLMLGRPYEIVGKVIHGKKRGRTIGYPTVNLELKAPYLLPKEGIYAGICYVLGKPYEALINVGMNPTFGELKEPLVEAHLRGYEGDCYGKTVYLSFARQGRGEKKFTGLEELKEQLQKDEKWVASLDLLHPKRPN